MLVPPVTLSFLPNSYMEVMGTKNVHQKPYVIGIFIFWLISIMFPKSDSSGSHFGISEQTYFKENPHDR